MEGINVGFWDGHIHASRVGTSERNPRSQLKGGSALFRHKE